MYTLYNKLWFYFSLVSMTALSLLLLFPHKQACHRLSSLQVIIWTRKGFEKCCRNGLHMEDFFFFFFNRAFGI